MRYRAIAVALGLLCGIPVVRGQVSVTASVTPEAGSILAYNYTLTNLSAPDDLVILSLTRPGPASVQNVMSPAGWDVLNEDAIFLDFIAIGPGLAVAAGPLTGFSYRTSQISGPVQFEALDAQGNVFNGVVPGTDPSAIPEPGTLAFLASGVVTASGRACRIRFRIRKRKIT